MPGRFALFASSSQIIDHFQLTEDMEPLNPRYNIAPGQRIPVIHEQGGQRLLTQMKWNFSNQDTKVIINARSESVAEKPYFKIAFETSRCIIPASAYYEWITNHKSKIPFMIHTVDKQIMAFAGIYQRHRKENKIIANVVTLTVDANKDIETIHHRMPALLRPMNYSTWLDPTNNDSMALKKLLTPNPEGELLYTEISKKINTVKIDVPDLIKPHRNIKQAELF